MTFLKSLSKVALITTTALTLTFSAKATDAFNEEFITQVQGLSASHPVLFQGFQETDFLSLRTFLKAEPGSTEERVVPKALVQKLYDRVAAFAEVDPRQKALALEVQTALTNENLDMYAYTAMIMRHQVFLRLKSGEACDFEKIALEVPGALGYSLFEKVQNPKFWTQNGRVAEFIKDFGRSKSPYNRTMAEAADAREKLKGETPHLFYPAFNHHELGIVYLAYMFLNEAFPLSCPDQVGPDPLHSLKMSPAGEIFHDFLHANEFGALMDHYGYASELMNNYREFLSRHVNERRSMITPKNPAGAYVRPAFQIPAPQQIAPQLLDLMAAKEDMMRSSMNRIFHKATQDFAAKKLSEEDYTTLMVAIFHRAHENYFNGENLFAAQSAEDLFNAFFMTSNKDDLDTLGTEVGVDMDNPFATSVLDGTSPLTDQEILEQATRLPLRKFDDFIGGENMQAGYLYDVIGGEVKRTPYHIGVTLQTQTGETLCLPQPSANFEWRLTAAHDTYLANLGSKGLNLPKLTMPNLQDVAGNPTHAKEDADFYLNNLVERFSQIHSRARDICMNFVSQLPGAREGQSFKDQMNEELATLGKSIMALFPESALKDVFGKSIEVPQSSEDDDGE